MSDLKFGTIKLNHNSLYWQQNTSNNDKLGVTGISVGGKNMGIPRNVNADNYGYIFDTASQMISVPGGNTYDSTQPDYYFYDRFVQTVLAGKKWTNTCFPSTTSGYYYNYNNNCYAVLCEPEKYESVFF